MLELKIHCNCRVCGSPVVIESINHTNNLYQMSKNETQETPFFAYHHKGFGDDQNFASGQCAKCWAVYNVLSGIISVTCDISSVDDESINEIQPDPHYLTSKITFLKWLKLQRHRDDAVGDLANEAYYTEGLGRKYKKGLDAAHPGRPKIATDYNEWVKFLHGKENALIAFYMAWSEFQLLKDYGRFK